MKIYIISILIVSVFLISTPVLIPTASAADMSIRDFINLLIVIGVITPEKIPAVNAYLVILDKSQTTSTPSITVLSPKDGEIFTNGETVIIPIELRVYNMPEKDELYISIIDSNNRILGAVHVWEPLDLAEIRRTNIYKYNLNTQIYAGQFRIKAQIASSRGDRNIVIKSELGLFELVSDTSDNSFTVIGRGTN